MSNFESIPKNEKNKEWFLLLKSLAAARINLGDWHDSPIIVTLNKSAGGNNWMTLKTLVERILKHVVNAKNIFSRKSEINRSTPAEADKIIGDLFSEVQAANYILYKGFKEITYKGKDKLDFTANLDNVLYCFEVAHIRGNGLKLQKKTESEHIGKGHEKFIKQMDEMFDQQIIKHEGPFQLESTKLISHLKSLYDAKKVQILKHGFNEHNALIIIVSGLMDFEEILLNHDQYQGKHPIQYFIDSTTIPCVILPVGWEPSGIAMKGIFGTLRKYNRVKFMTNDFDVE